MKIPFVGPSYEARSLNANAQRAINCFLETDRSSPNAPFALYGTPGLRLEETFGDAPVRGGIVMGNSSYFVAGSTVYRVNAGFNATSIGTIGTGSGSIGLAQNGTRVLIVDGVGGYLVAPGSVTTIADPEFPNGVTQCTSIDGYFIVTGLADSEQFFINETPRNANRWSGLDFASAEGSPDYTIACVACQRELWLFGSSSVEVWVNTGNADFPFERSSNVFTEQGCAAAETVVQMDNTVFWLGSGRYGSGIVYKAQGYNPVRISNHAMETTFAGYGDISDAKAFSYQANGHSFYVLTFPTADHTWVYDLATQEWHEWLWRNPSTNTLHQHRASCCVFFNDTNLVGDRENGKLYALDYDTYTDGTDPILRQRTTQTMAQEGKRMFFGTLQVDMETGVGLTTGQGSAPLLMLRYSNDGGHTWSNEKTASIGAVGEYGARARFGPSGSGRNRVWEITMTDPVKFAVFNAFVDVEMGS